MTLLARDAVPDADAEEVDPPPPALGARDPVPSRGEATEESPPCIPTSLSGVSASGPWTQARGVLRRRRRRLALLEAFAEVVVSPRSDDMREVRSGRDSSPPVRGKI